MGVETAADAEAIDGPPDRAGCGAAWWRVGEQRCAGMKTLLVVHHTLTGGTRQMAQAAATSAQVAEPALAVRLLRAQEAVAADVLGADAYLFAAPENLASMAGLMKDFFDRTYYPALGRIEGRPYAVLICAGSDGTGAARQIERIATGWRLKLIALPIIVNVQAQTPEAILAPKTIARHELRRCEELGAALASGLMLGVF
jgi:NADPH-dependent FMN reductase